MKCLSIRAPWWSWILEGGKDIENRSWSTDFRGTILVHASLFSNRTVIEENAKLAKAISKTVRKKHRLKLPQPFDFDAVRPLLGHVVGSVDIVDCVTKSKSAWYGGEFGFVLRNPVLLKPFLVKGALGLFNVDVREKDLKERR
jgi:hypothetical protein